MPSSSVPRGPTPSHPRPPRGARHFPWALVRGMMRGGGGTHAVPQTPTRRPGAPRGTFMVAAPAAGAQPDDDGDGPDRIVVITGRADVRPTDEVDVVVIIDGPVLVEGTVEGPVVAVNGDVQVRGVVEEDVVVVDGRVTIASGGVVEGDV